MENAYLLVISERSALRWIVSENRTAFARHRRRDAERLIVGDRLFLYTTRGCFHSPTHDRGRVFGVARVATATHEVDPPITFGETEYPFQVDMSIERLAAPRGGFELAPLVAGLPGKRLPIGVSYEPRNDIHIEPRVD